VGVVGLNIDADRDGGGGHTAVVLPLCSLASSHLCVAADPIAAVPETLSQEVCGRAGLWVWWVAV
jgi:hypothetical protein